MHARMEGGPAQSPVVGPKTTMLRRLHELSHCCETGILALLIMKMHTHRL